MRRHAEMLTGDVFGNPHSFNPTSGLATELVERTRDRVLSFFDASPDEYCVAFTANASHALKLVAESYPFDAGRPVPAHLRQPQLGERHPRVRARSRRRDDLRASDPAGHGVGRTGARVAAGARSRGAPRLVRVPCSVQLLRGAAPLVVDRPGAGCRVGRAAGCGGIRADQPARPVPVAPRLTSCCPSTRCSATRQGWARSSRRRRHSPGSDGRGSPAAPSPSPRSGPTATTWRPGHPAFEDGTLDFLEPARHRVRPRPPRARGTGLHPRTGAVPRRLADRAAGRAAALDRAAARPHLRAAVAREPRRDDYPELPRRRRPVHRSPAD